MKQPKTVLLVDDIPLMRTILGHYMKVVADRVLEDEGGSSGLEILEAGSAPQALERLRSDHVDAIFLDLMMPEMDGLTFLEQKQEDPALRSIPVVVCSALGGKDTIQRALHLGASSYLLKPYTLDSVHDKFSSILAPGSA